MNKLILFVVALMIYVGCKTTKVSPLPDESEKLWLSQWELIELGSKGVTYPTEKTANFLFSPAPDNRISGSTSCNRMSGSYQMSGTNTIAFSPMATTRMACLDENNIEKKFLEVLQLANNWTIKDNVLYLNNGEQLLARFRPVALVDPSLSKLSGNWELNYISGTRIAFDGLYPNKKPFVNFDFNNNRIAGHTSCNTFNGAMTFGSGSIKISEPITKTMMTCPGEGEQSFLNTLLKVNNYSLNNDSLVFKIDDVAVMRFAKQQ